MNLGGGQIRGTLFNFFVLEKCHFLHLLDAALSFCNNPWLITSYRGKNGGCSTFSENHAQKPVVSN